MSNLYSDLKIFNDTEYINNMPAGTNSPYHVRVKLTNHCNHRCTYCAFRDPKQSLGLNINQNDEIPFDKMVQTIHDFRELGVKAVTFSGAGEPCLYPDFPEIIRRMAPIKFAMLTNGSLFKDEIAELFAEYGSWVRISIDGWDRESYKTYRGADDFDKVIKNILNFKSNNCLLGLNIVVTNENASHIVDILQAIQGSQVREIKVSPCVVSDKIYQNVKYHEDYKQMIEDQIDTIRQAGIQVAYTYHTQFEEFKKDYTWCPNVQMRPVIGADCNIYSCHDKAYEKAGLLGSFKDCTFKEAWESLDVFKIKPNLDCQHHCISHNKNKMVHSFLNIYQDHITFV
jgi:MoaA/NifB/PqqE/SkfB family radical SAM enzyme